MKIHKVLLTSFLLLTYFLTYAQSNIDVRAWQLHHLDVEYCKKVIDRSKDYNINTIILSHGIIWTTMQLYDKSSHGKPDATRPGKIRELAQYIKSKGLKTWIWTHEFADVPSKYLENDIVQMDRRGFWKWLEGRYDQVLKEFPEFDGFLITFHEAQYRIFNNAQVNSKLPMPERFQKLINVLHKACKKYGKDLVVRTFVYEPEQLKWLEEGLQKVDDDIIVQSKCVPHDWQPFYPHNPVIGKFKGKKQIVEFDGSSEYTGRNHIPYTSPEYFSYRWQHGLQFPQVVGYNARIDHGGYDALFTPNEINIYTLHRVTENPNITADEIWSEWAKERYGEAAAGEIISILKPSFEIVNKLFFPYGVWFTDHTKLPHFEYANSHITYINKWDAANYATTTQKLLEPGMETFRGLLAEKDTAIALVQRSLWRLHQARPKLREQDYDDLNERLLLMMQTAMIWRYHAEAFFGYKLLEDHPELQPVILNAINNLKTMAKNIPEDQLRKPVARRDNILEIALELEGMIKNK
ncbi:MAG: hypothetical protein MJA30_27460 [Cytophagales bacterium]|nr:hypothetical protein [Cytophagales bacterium]